MSFVLLSFFCLFCCCIFCLFCCCLFCLFIVVFFCLFCLFLYFLYFEYFFCVFCCCIFSSSFFLFSFFSFFSFFLFSFFLFSFWQQLKRRRSRTTDNLVLVYYHNHRVHIYYNTNFHSNLTIFQFYHAQSVSQTQDIFCRQIYAVQWSIFGGDPQPTHPVEQTNVTLPD